MVKVKLSTFSPAGHGACCCGAESAVLTATAIFGAFPKNLPRRVRNPRHHEVDACMTPLNAHRPLLDEPAGALPAKRRGMAVRAAALTLNPAIASGTVAAGVAPVMARRRLTERARRNLNVHAHADRRAPPGGDPGRGR